MRNTCCAGSPCCWDWLVGELDLGATVGQLCEAMIQSKWSKWPGGDAALVNILNQIVAHSVCRVPITRKSKVPGTEGRPTTWQDLETMVWCTVAVQVIPMLCNAVELCSCISGCQQLIFAMKSHSEHMYRSWLHGQGLKVQAEVGQTRLH